MTLCLNWAHLQCLFFSVSLNAQKQSDETIQWLLASRHQSELELSTGDGYKEERVKHPTNEILFAVGPKNRTPIIVHTDTFQSVGIIYIYT